MRRGRSIRGPNHRNVRRSIDQSIDRPGCPDARAPNEIDRRSCNARMGLVANVPRPRAINFLGERQLSPRSGCHAAVSQAVHSRRGACLFVGGGAMHGISTRRCNRAVVRELIERSTARAVQSVQCSVQQPSEAEQQLCSSSSGEPSFACLRPAQNALPSPRALGRSKTLIHRPIPTHDRPGRDRSRPSERGAWTEPFRAGTRNTSGSRQPASASSER